MKKSLISLILLSSVGVSHCAAPTPNDATTPNAPTPAGEVTGMTDDELKALASSYTESLMAINTELQPSNIHGSRVKTFLDKTAFEAYTNKQFPYADQSVSVKESHASESGPINRLYVMKKIKGYDSTNGDWFYAVMSTEGVASQQGKVSFCISCHTGAKAKDYLFGFE